MAKEDDSAERQDRLREAGLWLRTQRELRGWSGSDLARRLGINQVRVSSYERGQYEVPSTLAVELANVFEMPVIEVRKQLGLWVPSDIDIEQQQQFADPAQLDDDTLIGELIRRYQHRSDREILSVYPHRSDVPRELWTALINNAKSEIFLGGYTNYFFWTEHSKFSDLLRSKSDAGTRIRVLVGDPDSLVTQHREQIERVPLTVSTRIRITLDELEKLGPVPGLEVRFSDTNAEAHVSRSVFQFDHQELVCEHIAERLGSGSLTFHLRKKQDDGPYNQYLTHLEHLWSGGRTWEP